MPSHLIDTQEVLDDACRRFAGESAIAVDTEFLRVRTYYPKLALVQVSAGDRIYCIDPLVEGLDLGGLWSVLGDATLVKVIHSARQDIEVLLHTAGVMPAPLFDTQIAAGLLGHGEQIGYAGLVETEFGKVLPKGAQRTDWTKRPLSTAQLGYAENDVRYLLPLYEGQRTRLRELGRLDWAREDFERVLDPDLYDTDPAVAYRRVGRGAHLKQRAQHHLRNLCAWREETARRRDLPRNWVVDDEAVAAIAAAGPQSVADLESVMGVRKDLVQRDGGAIVECIETPASSETLLWAKHSPLTAEEKTTKAELLGVLKSRAAALGVAESVLLTRSQVDRLARGASLQDTVRGWRLGEIGEDFERVLGSATGGRPHGNS